MAGKHLLDAAKLLGAARSIAQQHVELRAQQLRIYSDTSTLAKAAKSQSDRVTLTLEAAHALSQRLNQEIPQRITNAAQNVTRASHNAKHREFENAAAELKRRKTEFADEVQPASNRSPPGELEVKQEEAGKPPLPDGTIPETRAPSNLKVEIEDATVEQPNKKDAIGHSPHNIDGQLVGKKLESVQPKIFSPANEEVPRDINLDVFQSKRVGQMLGGNLHEKDYLVGHRDSSDTSNFIKGNTVQGTENNQAIIDDKTHSSSSMPATQTVDSSFAQEIIPPQKAAYELRESRVPSSRFGRLWQYAGLGTSMAFGVVGESLRRATGSGATSDGSLVLSPGNMELLVAKLSRMRGAALKLGQMISFQDIKMLPPAIHDVLQRVQDSADYMPASQRNQVLSSNLGADWKDLFEFFEEVPIAAASIGQVHKAVLRSTKQTVAVKVQYPGVANSIDSDLKNLSVLLTASRLLPKGLYLDKTIANARTELGWECDYTREAEWQSRFREALKDDTRTFFVPKVFSEASGREVLTAEFVHGVGVAKLPSLSQEKRDWIGTQILRLSLREIMEFKFMQTDPNWTNFLYNEKSGKLELLDFGASREFPNIFVEPYVNTLIAASKNDKTAVQDLSIELGYLTGAESQAMLDAHIQTVLTLAEPFCASGPEVYDFHDQTITDRVRSLIPIMVRERLAPPPEETYSMHRKLSGAFLLCARLGSRVPCKKLFETAVRSYQANGRMT